MTQPVRSLLPPLLSALLATWPFKDWHVTAHQRTQTTIGSSMALTAAGSSSGTAVYVVAQNSSGGNGW